MIKMIKRDTQKEREEEQKISIENYLKKKKMKRENIKKIDIIICMKNKKTT